MSEVAAMGEHHRQPEAVGAGYHVAIAERPARLHNRDDASRGRDLEPVREREERVRSEHGARCSRPSPFTGLAHARDSEAFEAI